MRTMRPILLLMMGLAFVMACDGSSEPDAGVLDTRAMDAPGNDAPIDIGPGELLTSITQYGITWTFDRAYPTGTYVTGDYRVVGPRTCD